MKFTSKQFLQLLLMTMASVKSPVRSMLDFSVIAEILIEARKHVENVPPPSDLEKSVYEELLRDGHGIETAKLLAPKMGK